MGVAIGWDIGGAHLKAARVRDGRIEIAAQEATPLWLGLHHLEAAFETLKSRFGDPAVHAITMTGELCDAFGSRREGVAGLAAIAARRLTPAPACVYAGRLGFRALKEAAEHADDVASANWHASAALVATRLPDALLIDIGSTTADLVPVVGGAVAAVGYTDAERLAAGELVYTGMTRSFVMAMADRAPFRGVWTPLMNEYFATSADVHRVVGDLPEGADQMATADGRDKTAAASHARLARMIGRDSSKAGPAEWEALASWFAEAQLRTIGDAAFLRLSRGDLAPDAPVVAAGIGERIGAELARRLGRRCVWFADLLGAGREASYCAPAAAVAMLVQRASAGTRA